MTLTIKTHYDYPVELFERIRELYGDPQVENELSNIAKLLPKSEYMSEVEFTPVPLEEDYTLFRIDIRVHIWFDNHDWREPSAFNDTLARTLELTPHNLYL